LIVKRIALYSTIAHPRILNAAFNIALFATSMITVSMFAKNTAIELNISASTALLC
jgi:transposase